MPFYLALRNVFGLTSVLFIFKHGHLGNASPVLSSQGVKKAIVEISYEVHDVVSKARRTKGHNGRIRTSTFSILFKRKHAGRQTRKHEEGRMDGLTDL